MPDRYSINRREFLAVSAAALMMPAALLTKSASAAAKVAVAGLNWPDFLTAMQSLAEKPGSGQSRASDVAIAGRQLMQQLNVMSPEFKQAIDESWESGNRFWLWQRLVKQADMKGGILNISQQEIVPLHDHPGATGMVRILSGEAEVWQYDLPEQVAPDGEVVLNRVSRTVLKAGDTAVLTPDKGNIHALQALTDDCAMLDFFIPPYDRPRRYWYEPQASGWKDSENIACQRIAEKDFQSS